MHGGTLIIYNYMKMLAFGVIRYKLHNMLFLIIRRIAIDSLMIIDFFNDGKMNVSVYVYIL